MRIDPNALGLEGKFSNGDFICKCPFHDDRNPSAIFHPDNGSLWCFSCGVLFSLEEIREVTSGDVIELIGVYDGKEKRQEVDLSFLNSLPLALDNTYLKSRGVTDEQVREFGIKQSDNGIVFPVPNVRGEIIAAQTRFTDGRDMRYKSIGTLPVLFPMNRLPKDNAAKRKLFLCEGIFGALRGRREGFAAYATFGVSRFLSKELWNYMALFEEIVILPDPDEAGQKMVDKLKASGINTCEVSIPDNLPDAPDEFVWRIILEDYYDC